MKFKKSLPYLLPSLAGLSVFYLIPFLLSFYYALINNMGSKEFVGLQNFINTVQNQMFQKGLLNTTVFMLISIPVLIVIALFIALLQWVGNLNSDYHISLEKHRVCCGNLLCGDKKNSLGILRTRRLRRSKPVAAIPPRYMDLSFSDHICCFNFIIYNLLQNI